MCDNEFLKLRPPGTTWSIELMKEQQRRGATSQGQAPLSQTESAKE
jgi:hypothetical protein